MVRPAVVWGLNKQQIPSSTLEESTSCPAWSVISTNSMWEEVEIEKDPETITAAYCWSCH
jgi:hypothetical protein